MSVEVSHAFRSEFISAITSPQTPSSVFERLAQRKRLRIFLAKSKFLKSIYNLLKTIITFKKNANNKNVFLSNSIQITGELQNFASIPRTKLFIVVPYFLEMNGPDSHYGTLLNICKSLDLDVYYVATEKSFIHNISESSYKNFKNVSLVDPSDLTVLFSKNSLIVNCGSPWIYRNIQDLNECGSLMIDYLFNHVGHTASNMRHRDMLFHTVCQHEKLRQILIESSNHSSQYSCIPIPFPKVSQNNALVNSQKENVLWVGRLSPEKGVQRLTDISLNYFKRTGQVIRVIGSGDLAKKLKPGIQVGSIDFVGELSHLQTLQEIECSKMVINTSFVEGVSIVAMEALSVGSFVVSFDVGGMSELLWHPQMKISTGSIQDFVDLMISLDRFEAQDIVGLPAEYELHSHTKSWMELLNTALKCLS